MLLLALSPLLLVTAGLFVLEIPVVMGVAVLTVEASTGLVQELTPVTVL
jgi:hypothetical protein